MNLIMKYFYIPFILTMLAACSGNGHKSDAYGNFEAIEVLVSAETRGGEGGTSEARGRALISLLPG